MERRAYLLALGATTAGALAGCSGDDSGEETPEPDLPVEREIDPTRTDLRTNDDSAGDTEPIDLDALGI